MYKFRDWGNQYHKEVLYQKKIYIPRPEELNDPVDCNVQFDYLNLSNIEFEAYCKRLVLNYAKKLSDLGYDLAERESNLINRAQNRPKFQQEMDQMSYYLMNQRIGVFSLSKDWNNLPLWAHYGGNHKGFAIGFKTESVIRTEYFQNGGEVKYDDAYPKLDPRMPFDIFTWIKIVTAKSKKWEHENEFRFIRRWENDLDQFWSFSSNIINEIILGINFNPNELENLIFLCNQNNWKLYQVKIQPLSFLLSRTLIN